MVNEVTIHKYYGQNGSGDKEGYTCASAVAISKGTLLTLSDPNTVSSAAITNSVFGGIASMDKASNDNSTQVSAWQNVIANIVSSGNITAGDKVALAANNRVFSFNALTSHQIGAEVGIARESASDGDRIKVRVNI